MERESRSSYRQLLLAFVSCFSTRLFLLATTVRVTTRSTLSSPPMDFRSPEAASVRVPATFSILRHVYFSPYFSPVPSSFFRVSSFKRVCSVSNGVATSANLTRVTRNQTKPSSFYVKPVIKSKKKYYTLEYRRNDNFGISSLRFPPLSRTIFRFRFFSIEKPSPPLFSLLHRIDNARSLSHF